VLFISEYGEMAIKGGLRVEGPITYYDSVGKNSDSRLKEDICDLSFSLEKFLKLRPVSFKYNGLLGHKKNKKEIGLIAQEVQALIPDRVRAEQLNMDDESLELDEVL